MNYLRIIWLQFLTRIWLAAGTRLFPLLMTWGPDQKRFMNVVTFATNQRDINIAYRSYVEWLDEEYEKRQKENKTTSKS